MDARGGAAVLSAFLGVSGAALVLAVALLVYLRSRHPFHRVPFARILLFFLYGAVVAPVAALVAYALVESLAGNTATLLGAFAVIGPLEEGVKIAGPFLVLRLVARWRAEPFEWMMAAAASAVGFAMTENILYAVTAEGEAIRVLAWRSVAPMHLLWSAVVGYRVGRNGPAGFLAGFLLASFLHGLWDALCFTGLTGLLVALFGGQLLGFGWHIRKMTWLCANRSPRRPDAEADARVALPRPGGIACAECGVDFETRTLRGVDFTSCPSCLRVALGREDLFRLVSAYAGSKGWFGSREWYGYYWHDDEGLALTCPACRKSAPGRRFLLDDGPGFGFCSECGIATAEEKDVFAVLQAYRNRLEIGFLS